MSGLRGHSALASLALAHVDSRAGQSLALLAGVTGLSGAAIAIVTFRRLTMHPSGPFPALLFAALLILFAVAARAVQRRSATVADQIGAGSQAASHAKPARSPLAAAVPLATLAAICTAQLAGWSAYLFWAQPAAAWAIGGVLAVLAGWCTHAMDAALPPAGRRAPGSAPPAHGPETEAQAALCMRGVLLVMTMLYLLTGAALFGDALAPGLDPLATTLGILLGTPALLILAQIAPRLLAAERDARRRPENGAGATAGGRATEDRHDA